MTQQLISLVLLIIFGFAVTLVSGDEKKEKSTKLLRHVVMFKFKDSATEQDIKKITDAFAELPSKIDTIHSFEWGTDNSPEGLADGFTHCFLVTFLNEKGRDAHLTHAAHKAFVAILKPYLDKVMVIDYRVTS